jgi:aconitate hydratase
VQAVIASYERIHNSKVRMGFSWFSGQNPTRSSFCRKSLRSPESALSSAFAAGSKIKVKASKDVKTTEFDAIVRIDTPQEAQYYANGGILQYVLRQLLAAKPETVHA